jgi:type IV secretion system protein VirB6
MIDLVDLITNAAVSWLITAYASMQGMVNTGLLAACVTLFIVLYGYAVLSGRLQVTMPELSSRIAILIIVFLGVTNVGYFNSILRLFFLSVPDSIANGLVGGGGSNEVRTALESCFDEAFRAATAIWDNASWRDILQNFLGILIIVAVTAFVGYACFLLTLSKVASCVLLAMTPLVFIGLLFPLTRTIFERWLGLLFNYFFIPILTFLILSFIAHVARDVAQEIQTAMADGSSVALDPIAKFLGCCVIGMLLLMQVMTMASSLGGGVALSTMSAAGAAGAWMRNRFSPGKKSYINGGDGFEGRTRTATGDLRRTARAVGYSRDRDGKSPKGK